LYVLMRTVMLYGQLFILMCLCADEVALETVTEEGGRYVLVVLGCQLMVTPPLI